jgi:hypothetical protein
MKAKFVALVAAPLMGISSLTFAAQQEPVMLSHAEMDSVTAAGSLITIGNVNAAVQVNALSAFNKNSAYQKNSGYHH